ncbi:Pimeloyl-ACP methyl ester carboxylesterase [Catalinimonas alkaloidigena]|uniref:Pimeloyl-ACP methyl ester carboxylesterase n=1 Tax=Catalinimonas alkaloidigena TaxID=1075417 RepID=A0A1G9P6M3_9BACT|nr:alpha/beta hydrolase [Catalinimonas alkaloidigena]SDL93805.1 Pimeloyl-ACP methyl ester carboxylesterase [Catalinimonas alkaloidigena]
MMEEFVTESPAAAAATQFAALATSKIAYRTFGHGVPLVLCNRFRGVLDTWDPLFLDLLAAQHTLIIFDYPGVGDSTGTLPTEITDVADVVTQLADYLQLDTFSVLGWSFGGLVAQTVTFLYPTRVRKTVLIGTNPPGTNEVAIEQTFFDHALKPRNDLDDETVLFFEPAVARSRQAAQASHARIAPRLNRTLIPSTPELFQRYFAASATFREDKHQLRARYQKPHAPVLVVMGDHDVSFAVQNWFPLLRQAGHTQLLILPEAGHAPQHQYPALVVGYLNTFLGQVVS